METISYHRLLLRQIRRFVKPEMVDDLSHFLESISHFYVEAEKERRLLEQTLDVNSKELEEANRTLRRQHEEMHDSILNALTVGLLAVDTEGKIIFANNSANHMFGYLHQELIGHPITQFIEKKELRDVIKHGIEPGRREGESVLKTVLGDYIPVLYSTYPIMHDGQVKGTVFSLIDITLDKKRQDLITLQQLALESSASMMLISDKEGNIQYANKEFSRVSGYESEDIIGAGSDLIINDKINDPRIVKECWKTVRSGNVWKQKILSQTKSNDVYFEELILTPLINKGEVTHFVAVKKDISDWIQSQEELKNARDKAINAMRQAEEANRAKDTFLSNMSHELRTPLNAINGFSQILISQSDTKESIKKIIEKILISGNSLLTLVNTILDFSKIESGKMEVTLAPFLMEDLLKEVKILVEPMAAKHNLSLDMDLKKGSLIYADRQLIKQVLVNLLSNAIKFSPDDKSIFLEHRSNENEDIFGICDQGHGIQEDKIKTLFDPFVQIREHQKGSIKGSGLGLSIVKKIIELHNGRVWIESNEGEGSRFYFTLPKSAPNIL